MNKNNIKYLCTIYAIALVSFVFPYQGIAKKSDAILPIKVKNNGSILSYASKKELTRVEFKGENIDSIYSIQGEFQYEIDGSNLYIKLNEPATEEEKPINFFVKTAANNTYKVILVPQETSAFYIPVENINFLGVTSTLDTIQEEKKLSNSYEGETLLQRRISQLIKVALADEKHLGFSVRYHTNSSIKTVKDYKQLKQRALATWIGEGLKGLLFQIENLSSATIFIEKKAFDEGKTLAIYLDSEQLGPGQSTKLILIERKQE